MVLAVERVRERLLRAVAARQKIRPEYESPSPDVLEAAKPGNFQVVHIESLVRMKLTSYRDKDKTHLRDLLEIGLIDSSWVAKFSPELGARLQQLIDTP